MMHHTLSSTLLLCLAALAVPRAFGEPPDLAARVGKQEQSLTNQGLLDLLRELENLKREVKRQRWPLMPRCNCQLTLISSPTYW